MGKKYGIGVVLDVETDICINPLQELRLHPVALCVTSEAY